MLNGFKLLIDKAVVFEKRVPIEPRPASLLDVLGSVQERFGKAQRPLHHFERRERLWKDGNVQICCRLLRQVLLPQ